MPEPHPIYDGIKAIFDADTVAGGVAALATGGGFSDQAGRDTDPPFVRWVLITDIPDQRLASGESVDASIQFDVYTDRLNGAAGQAINARLRTLFDRQDVTVVGFSRSHFMCTNRGKLSREDTYYRIRSEYKMFGSAA